MKNIYILKSGHLIELDHYLFTRYGAQFLVAIGIITFFSIFTMVLKHI